MTSLEIGIAGFGVLLLLLAVRIPIGVAMLTVGIIGYTSIAGEAALFSYLKTETGDTDFQRGHGWLSGSPEYAPARSSAMLRPIV